jgi:hypothetical protein
MVLQGALQCYKKRWTLPFAGSKSKSFYKLAVFLLGNMATVILGIIGSGTFFE